MPNKLSTPLLLLAIAACNESPRAISDAEPLDQGEWQLVSRDYPYKQNGALVCAEWELSNAEDTEITERELEYYHPEVMNRQLDGVPQVGEELSAAIVDALRAGGIAKVETCEDARRFIQVKRSILESEPFKPENDASTDGEIPLPGAAFSEEPIDQVEKVIDGQTWTNLPTVLLRIWDSAGGPLPGCSGTLIGPNSILSAAHCFPLGDGYYRVSVATQGGATCVSSYQPGANNCAVPTTYQFHITRKPGYSGTGDTGDDVAIAWHTGGSWLSPANTSASWMRINNMSGSLSANYWVSGYGYSTWNGLGDGIGRIALQAQNIDWSGSNHWYSIRDTYGVGAACKGDSGGPAITTSFGFDMNVGVVSNGELYAGHTCPSVEGNHKFRYAHTGRWGSWIDSVVTAYGGSCTDYLYNNAWHYLRCW